MLGGGCSYPTERLFPFSAQKGTSKAQKGNKLNISKKEQAVGGLFLLRGGMSR